MKWNVLAGIVLLTGAGALAYAPAFALEPVGDPGNKLLDGSFNRERASALHQPTLSVSAGSDPDTVWVGHSYTDHWSATRNWWNVFAGTNRPGTSNENNSIWNWDHATGLANHGIADSLAGWWPARRAYTITGGLTLPDASRPWWAIDMGNIANYVLNQGAAGKRTKGVVGVWHADGGLGQPGGSAVQWSPLSGSRSAWCGLRQLNDVSVTDAVTGQPFNQAAVDFLGTGSPTNPTVKRFPGYCGQWDQMLYRDIAAPAGQPLTLSFLYRTRMSTRADQAAATRTGWFHGDPLAVTAGNFISATDAGANAPIDSFMVYVGAPVNDATCLYSDGNARPVFDPQRRWFSEVLRVFDAPCRRLFAVSGSVPADTLAATPWSGTLTVPAAYVDAIRNAAGNSGHLVRLVFRVKTNRGFADDDGLFDSATRGAALLDDVTVNGANIGDFETPEQGGANAIDNRTSASALTNWKSTGKPPSIYYHLANVSNGDVTYNDLCGPWDSPWRYCDISGNTLDAGNHDDFERHGDSNIRSDREVMHGAWSPTIDLVVDEGGAPNPMGITAGTKHATDDYYVRYDLYAGMFNLQFSGNAWTYGAQGWPCRQPNNGAAVWGDPEYASFQMFCPEPQCLWDIEPLYAANLLAADTPSGLPDSLRFFLGTNSQCFRFAVSLGCNSADGAYFDNVSLALVDWPFESGMAAISPMGLTSDPWEWIADAFPANETATLPNQAAFDTAAALVKGSANIAPETGDASRFDVLADTIVVKAPDVAGSSDPVVGNATRVDLVFRVLPGPGNYATATSRTFPVTSTMHLLRVPTNQGVAATAGDGSFWGEYLAAPGAFAGGDHHGGAWWDYLTWNSARCDTAERNIFPVAGLAGTRLTAGAYANMLHESDPKFATLGVPKFRCFVVDTTQPAAQANIACDGSVPAWLTILPHEHTGWDGTNSTKEFTKIIPDGLLTPGAHVQYFWRKSALADSSVFAMEPDTNAVFQLRGEGSTDGHRWEQFGVLPDRWKDVAFGGWGMACALYVDLADRRGDERSFVSVMDSLGATSTAKRGAHNGWSAPGIPGAVGTDLASYPVHGKNQQPGTTWDLYNVRGAESLTTGGVSPGNRLANRASMGLLAGKAANTGPTPELLRHFYRLVIVLSGDLTSGVLGPFTNRSQNDIALLNEFLTGNEAGSTPQPRGLHVSGDGFLQSETWTGGLEPSHLMFLMTKLGVTLRNASYQSVSGNTNDCADLITTNLITPSGDVYGIGNSCAWSNDLLQRNASVPEAVEATYYQNVGVNAPYVASVYKPANATRNWVAYTSGWDLAHEWRRYCEDTYGRMADQWQTYNNLFGSNCQVIPARACVPWDYCCFDPFHCGDVPGATARFRDYLRMAGNPMRGSSSTVRFGVESAQRVRVRIHDVAGRLVRTLADRSFTPGEYTVAWDGADDGGRQVARGVYFARLEFADRGGALTTRVVVLR